LIFAGYDEKHELVGVAIEAQRMGYQDVIQLLYGYSLEEEALIGMRVLSSRETPGLGDRIETDATFQQNFVALDMRLADGGEQLAHPIEFVKPGEKASPWQIDGISGATISSQAVAEMLRDSSAEWIPRIQQHRSDFKYQHDAQASVSRLLAFFEQS
jgi:electron transport complex protein RnfG